MTIVQAGDSTKNLSFGTNETVAEQFDLRPRISFRRGSNDRLYWRIVYTWAILPPHRIPAETDTSRNGSQLCNGATVLSLCQRRVCFLGRFAEVPDRGFEFDKRGQLFVTAHNETVAVALGDNNKDVSLL